MTHLWNHDLQTLSTIAICMRYALKTSLAFGFIFSAAVLNQ